MDQKVRKKEFLSAFIANAFSENRKSNLELCQELGISDRHFYNLRQKYASEINEQASRARAAIRLAAFAALQKKLLAPETGNEVIELALSMSGDLGKNNQVIVGTAAGEGANKTATTIVNIGTMDATELERLVDSRLQATRSKNTGKLKK